MPVTPVLPHRLRELPPHCAKICLSIRQFIAKLLPLEKPSFVVAFSGGADSTALAIILRCLDYPLSLAHLDHCIREESGQETLTVARFAQALNVPFLTAEINVPDQARQAGVGLEEYGRQARYAFLEKARTQFGASWTAVGHHLDDLSEDMLMRLIRGTGWPGLGGMKALDRERRLIRPLLMLPKEELYHFLRCIGVTWLEDVSNKNDAFRRNRVRHHIIPLLQKENPAFSRSVATLWELARTDELFWEEQLQPVLRQIQTVAAGLLLPRSAFITLPRAIRLRAFMALIQRLGSGQTRAKTLFDLDTASATSQATKQFRFPGGIVVRTDKEGLYAFVQARKVKQNQP